MNETIKTERGPVGFAFAAVINFVFMMILNAHAVWRPWLRGIVTPAFIDVLWAINLSCAVQIVGNLLLSISSQRPLRRFMDLLFAVVSLIGAVVMYRVFPIDLSRFGDAAVIFARAVLMFAVIAACLAILVNVVRFLGSGGKRPPTPAHP
jgi:hypothetical protein